MQTNEVKIIDPETAAHNIALSLCSKINFDTSKINLDDIISCDTYISDISCKLANLYAYAYDSAFSEIESLNEASKKY